MACVTVLSAEALHTSILAHLLRAVQRTPAHDQPFSHLYIENVFPDDVYAEMMEELPDPAHYTPLSPRKHSRADGTSTRDVLPLSSAERLAALPQSQQQLWSAVASALTAPEL